MAIVTRVIIARFAEKQLKKLPLHIKEALRYWVEGLQLVGIRELRKMRGYHDEPLKGARNGQRSMRLNKSYRAIYIEISEGIEVLVIEVNKHEY